MHTQHNAEGHFLSRGARWMAIPLVGAEEADIGPNES
jgi:hypothetical protein